MALELLSQIYLRAASVYLTLPLVSSMGLGTLILSIKRSTRYKMIQYIRM
jgi:hypothetical protein